AGAVGAGVDVSVSSAESFGADEISIALLAPKRAAGALQNICSSARCLHHPMDPEMRQDHPGPCPKCGMALEPSVPIFASFSVSVSVIVESLIEVLSRSARTINLLGAAPR